jgi:hypothetical protein
MRTLSSSRFVGRRRTHVVTLSAVLAATAWLGAQSGLSLTANIARLVTYPDFYNGKTVVVRGQVVDRGGQAYLAARDAAASLRLVATGARVAAGEAVELRGELLDVGRLRPDDVRLSFAEVAPLVPPAEAWPKPGELLLFLARSAESIVESGVPTIRSIVLAPETYDGRGVTIVGQFRGLNLYGDLPRSPGISRWDFVVRAGSAAVWVTGMRPRGRGFDLNADAKVDTDQWLQVTGTVRRGRGLEWIEASSLTSSKAQADEPEAAAVPPPPPPPPPRVVFSMPAEGETEVPTTTDVKIQVSRDLKTDSVKGHVRASYLGQAVAPGEAAPPALNFTVTYQPGNRAIVITFWRPLERFRTVKIELLEGIVATDDQPLAPWALTFSLGGSS